MPQDVFNYNLGGRSFVSDDERIPVICSDSTDSLSYSASSCRNIRLHRKSLTTRTDPFIFHKHWTQSFVQPEASVDRIKAAVDEKYNSFDWGPYNRHIVLSQSSGFGKSRAVDEMSRSLPTFAFYLRPVGGTPHPHLSS